MRPPYTLVATLGLVLLAAPVSASTALDSADTCLPSPCETINNACRKVLHTDCVALEADGTDAAQAEDCMGAVCDAINRVCQRVGGANCLGMAATTETEPRDVLTTRCTGLPCDVVNLACTIVRGGPCVR